MKTLIKTFQIVIFSTLALVAQGQNWAFDSLKWGSKVFIVELPDTFRRSVSSYKEGVFVHYISPDTSEFAVFYGWNAVVTLYKQEDFDTLSADANIFTGTIRELDRHWKANKQSEHFIYWYNLVKPEQLETFDRIFNSFELADR